ncbi:unnamed protein product [marine sediment metagenome]|uniref:Uncharacterized protein n=1 Tax=marine sediment metagenome TaxID=412755 RepID=X1J7U1_9ZZZZ
MSYMRVGHEEVVIPYASSASFLGTPMNSGIFPDKISVSYLYEALSIFKVYVLGQSSNNYSLANSAFFTDVSPAIQLNMGTNFSFSTNSHVFSNYRIRIYLHPLI